MKKVTTTSLLAELQSLTESPKFRADVADMVKSLGLYTAAEWNKTVN